MSNGLLLIVAKTTFGVIISAFYPKGKIVLELIKIVLLFYFDLF